MYRDDKNEAENELESAKKNQISRSNVGKATPLSTTVGWLVFWFTQNTAITFLNKKAMSPIRLPTTLTMFHMICNTIAAYLYIHVFKQIEPKTLSKEQSNLLFYFSMIFVSNIITGNWSLGTVSVSFNQIMRALVPAATVVLSMLILNRTFSLQRKLSLLPIATGVYIACTGDNTFTTFGLVITIVAVCFAAVKAVLSSKFLTGDLKLHPVDLVLHQAPLSALWCFFIIFLTGEDKVIRENLPELQAQLPWFLLTGIMSFTLNISSFFANKVTSALTLTVCGNVKQTVVIFLSIYLNNDVLTAQKAFGILIVICGGGLYSYIGYKESQSNK